MSFLHLSPRLFAIAALAFASTAAAARTRSVSTSPPNFSDDSLAVASSVKAFHAALAAGDSAAALRLLASDVTILESGGVENLADYRSHHLPADIEFAKAVKTVSAPLAVTLSGSTAWVAGTSTTQGSYRGRDINSVGAESMVLTREPGGWMIRSIHWSSRSRRTN